MESLDRRYEIGDRSFGAPAEVSPSVGRGILDAPDLPLGGKVAFAEQMTDEGAKGRTVHYPRRHPHQSALRLTASPFQGEAFCRGGPMWPPASQGGAIMGPPREPSEAGRVGRGGAAK